MDENEGDFPFTLEELTTGLRSEEEAKTLDVETIKDTRFAFVMDRFMPVVVGTHIWQFYQWQKKIPDFTNKTDEALVWFLLENNYKTWESAYRKKMASSEEGLSGEENQIPAEDIEVSQPKFTGTSRGKNAQKYRGWSPEGAKRWNEIVKELEEINQNQALQKYYEVYKEWKVKVETNEQDKKLRKRARQGVVADEPGEVTMIHGFD